MKTKINEVYELVLTFDTQEEAKAVHEHFDYAPGRIIIRAYSGGVPMTKSFMGNAEDLEGYRQRALEAIATMHRREGG